MWTPTREEAILDTRALIGMIEESPTAFHAVKALADRLEAAGFRPLREQDDWALQPGDACYVTRNQSSILAFRVPEERPRSIRMIASHSDSPTFQVKGEGEMDAFGKFVKLNTERYGGGILATWLDRPLSLAGRAVVREGACYRSKLINLDRDLLLIPNVAIHFNRAINDGYKYNPACDTLPVLAGPGAKGCLKKLVAEAAGCTEDALESTELYLYNRTPAAIWGANEEFFSAPRIDNLQCAYGSLMGFLAAERPTDAITVCAVFDNEETGSASRQGADSPFLHDVLCRIAEATGTDLRRLLAGSFLVSADNAHAKHPNHPELSDGQNAPNLNEGPVIKFNAAKRYTTDGLSEALFAAVCRKADVPVQHFANRSDLAGGSTLGNLSNTQVALCAVDIGMPQLAMHSCYETAGTADTSYLIRAAKTFYETSIEALEDGSYRLL